MNTAWPVKLIAINDFLYYTYIQEQDLHILPLLPGDLI